MWKHVVDLLWDGVQATASTSFVPEGSDVVPCDDEEFDVVHTNKPTSPCRERCRSVSSITVLMEGHFATRATSNMSRSDSAHSHSTHVSIKRSALIVVDATDQPAELTHVSM